ncbi:DNA polymerase epsilon subunit D-like protein [Elsinoe fawcettii]|nr:DNA polymerase epsilon subunit D-like protein [Elsinoe fawcettii]
MVQRLAKGVLPSNTQIQKDALLAISKSATVFVNFLASQASENALASGKKTIMPHDVYAALKENEFDSFVERVKEETISMLQTLAYKTDLVTCKMDTNALTNYHPEYNEIQCDKRNTYRRTKAAEKKAAGTDGAPNVDVMDEDGQIGSNGTNGVADEGAEPPSKKLRREDGDDGDDIPEDEVELYEPDDDVEDEIDSADEEVEEEIEEEQVGEVDEAEDDEEERANGVRDEALDEPDSD